MSLSLLRLQRHYKCHAHYCCCWGSPKPPNCCWPVLKLSWSTSTVRCLLRATVTLRWWWWWSTSTDLRAQSCFEIQLRDWQELQDSSVQKPQLKSFFFGSLRLPNSCMFTTQLVHWIPPTWNQMQLGNAWSRSWLQTRSLEVGQGDCTYCLKGTLFFRKCWTQKRCPTEETVFGWERTRKSQETTATSIFRKVPCSEIMVLSTLYAAALRAFPQNISG